MLLAAGGAAVEVVAQSRDALVGLGTLDLELADEAAAPPALAVEHHFAVLPGVRSLTPASSSANL